MAREVVRDIVCRSEIWKGDAEHVASEASSVSH